MKDVRVGLLHRVRRARLAGMVIRRLRRAGFTDARYDARGFRVRFTAHGDDTPTILELAPLLAARGGRRRERVNRFVAGLVGAPRLPQTWSEARPLLRPVLRGGTPGAPLRRPVLPFLFEYVVIDQPHTMTYVGPDQPARWEVSNEEVFEAARANLSGAVLHGVATEPVVVRFVDNGDAYWTSHLLLPHWLERLAEQVGGPPVAFAPERGTLLVTAGGSDHLGGLFTLAEEIYASSSRAITPMAYTSDDQGCPVPYPAPPGHPLHRAVQRAQCLLAVHEYTRQQSYHHTEGPPPATAHQAAPPRRAAHPVGMSTPEQPSDQAAVHGHATPTAPAPAPAPPPDADPVPAPTSAPTSASASGVEPPRKAPTNSAPPAATAAAGHPPAAADGMHTQQAADAETAQQAADSGHAQKATDNGRAQTATGPAHLPTTAGLVADREPVGRMADLVLVGSDDDGWRTRAVWERDGPILLPAADEVQVGSEVRPWATVRRHLTAAPGFNPPRWAADRWPPD